MSSSVHGDWGDTPDDGSELVSYLHRLLPHDPETSSEESDTDLVTVSERSYHSAESVRAALSYSAAAQKNLPKEDIPKETPSRPSYLSDFEREHFHRENVMPDRPYTAFFTAPAASFTTKDIFDSLLTDGVPASAVRCLQRSPNGNVIITFASMQYRDLFLRRSSFVVRRERYVTHPGSRRLLFVTVYDAPHELPDSALEYRLSRYGRIFSSRRGKVPGYPEVFNGLRHFRIDLNTHIPCFLRFGKFQVRVKYDGQPVTCRRCNSRDHLFKDCNQEICFNCDSTGHHSRVCPDEIRCCICKEEGHMAIDCQHSWYRRPSAPEVPPSTSAPEAAAVDPLTDQTAPEDGSSSLQMSVEVNVSQVVAQSSPLSSSEPVSPVAESQLPVNALDSQGRLIPEKPAAAQTSVDTASSLPEPSLSDSALIAADVACSPPEPSLPDSVLVMADVASSLPEPSLSDSALIAADVVCSPPEPSLPDSVLVMADVASSLPEPSLSDSALVTAVDLSSASTPVPRDPASSVPDSVPLLLDAAALDVTLPDGNDDDDEMGDSPTVCDGQELATAWKRISRKKGRKKNLARKATGAASDLFVPVRKATRPNLPGTRSSKGKGTSQ